MRTIQNKMKDYWLRWRWCWQELRRDTKQTHCEWIKTGNVGYSETAKTMHDLKSKRSYPGQLKDCVALNITAISISSLFHDHVMKWKDIPRYWPFMRGIHRSPLNSPHKSHWRGTLMFSLICAWIKGGVSYGETGDLWRHSNVSRRLILAAWMYEAWVYDTLNIQCGAVITRSIFSKIITIDTP